MLFGVIYSVDVLGEAFEQHPKLAEWNPITRLKQRGTWVRTETSKTKDYEGSVAHGKWCALLTKSQFKDFVSLFGFEYRTCCATAGAIGMPGCSPWYGHAPAWSFDANEYSVLANIYVTPWPDVSHSTGVSDRPENWDRIKRAMACLFS